MKSGGKSISVIRNSFEPFISIAIASYNYAARLSVAFASIKQQKFTDYEVLYVDDCSTDNSVEVIESFIKENPSLNIRLIKNEKNMGLVYSKNRLISEARGKYIMLCDADDWMLDDCLETLAAVAKATNADRIVSQVRDVDESGRTVQIQDFDSEQSKWLWNIHHGSLYKADLIRKNDIKIKDYPDDVYFTTDFNLYARKTVFIQKELYVWFVHNDSAGRKKIFDNMFDEIIETYTKLFEYISGSIACLKKICQEDAVFEQKSKEDNIFALELLMLKCYYLAILGELRRFPFFTQINGYVALRKNLNDVYGGWKANPYLSFFSKSPMRPYATRIIRFCVFFERMHVMKVVLFFYSIVCKFVTFDQ